MKTLKDFTPEIKSKIPEYQKRCMDLSGDKVIRLILHLKTNSSSCF